MADQADTNGRSQRPVSRSLQIVLVAMILFFAAFAVFLVLGNHFTQLPYGTALLVVTIVQVFVLLSISNHLYPPQSLRQAVQRSVLGLIALAATLLPLCVLGLGGIAWGVVGFVWMSLAFARAPHSKPIRPVVALFGLALLAL